MAEKEKKLEALRVKLKSDRELAHTKYLHQLVAKNKERKAKQAEQRKVRKHDEKIKNADTGGKGRPKQATTEHSVAE
jgi:hypothetical protein